MRCCFHQANYKSLYNPAGLVHQCGLDTPEEVVIIKQIIVNCWLICYDTSTWGSSVDINEWINEYMTNKVKKLSHFDEIFAFS